MKYISTIRAEFARLRLTGQEEAAKQRMEILVPFTNIMASHADLSAVENPTRNQRRLLAHYERLLQDRKIHVQYAQRAHEKLCITRQMVEAIV